MANALVRLPPSPWPKMVIGYPFAGCGRVAGSGTVITKDILGAVHLVVSGLITPRGSVRAKRSRISPTYHVPTLVAGMPPPGGGMAWIQSGTDGTCVAAKGAPCSCESVVT